MYSLFTWLNLQILNLCWHIESCRHMKTHRVLNRSRKCAFTINSRSKLKTFSSPLLRHLLRFHGGPFELKTLEIFCFLFELEFFQVLQSALLKNKKISKKIWATLKLLDTARDKRKKVKRKKEKEKKLGQVKQQQ